MTNADQYCLEKASPDGSSLYYALLFEQPDVRRKLLPLFALHYEISDCLTASSDPGVIRVKLQWWSEELARLSGHEPRHPVTTALLPVVVENGTDMALFNHYLETTGTLLSRRAASLSASEWLQQMQSGLGDLWMAAAAIANRQATPAPVLQQNGGTIFLVELLQNIHYLIPRGIVFIPEELRETPDAQGIALVRFQTVFETLEAQLAQDYPALLRLGKQTDYYHRIMNRLASAVCAEIRLDGYQLIRHKIVLTPLRKLWIATRTRYLG
jgi:15-cis-phytoene synthase